ncbi:MAG: prepilin peptidase [Deltaproteobacteria bacterium]|jgi:leader peptidase (prepilin peptidase)/N-methyltransferase|nr:prepilin peptidase [Deltaproteobacteria bacterium]
MYFEGPAGIVLPIVIFLAGLALGSFLNVVIYRLPREGLGLARPRRSFCPHCQQPLSWSDNIPLFGWLRLRGRCRHCRAPISFRYPLVELMAAILALSLYSIEGISPRFFIYYYFVLALTAIAFIDLELMVIPNQLVYPTYLLGFIGALVSPDPRLPGAYFWDKFIMAGASPRLVSLLGGVAGFLLGFFFLFLVSRGYKLWRGRKGMGDGDPPLLGLIGLFLGWAAVPPVALLATILGLLAVIALASGGKLKEARAEELALKPIAFGPFLALAAVIWYLYGREIMAWYQGFF